MLRIFSIFQICSTRVHGFVHRISQIIVPGGAGVRKNDVMRKLLILKHRRLFFGIKRFSVFTFLDFTFFNFIDFVTS